MKISGFKFRNVNLDDVIYSLAVNYGKVDVGDKQSIQYKEFKVVSSKDRKMHHFLVYGDYYKENIMKSFEVCVEEIQNKDYDSSFIAKVFFNSRATLNEIVRAYMNGYKMREPQQVFVQEKQEENIDFDDTFIASEVLPVKEQVEQEIVAEPVIILPSIKNRSSSIKQAKPAKKTAHKRKTTK